MNKTKDFRNEFTREIRTKVLIKFATNNFGLGTFKEFIPNADFITNAIIADHLEHYYIQS